MIAEETLYLNFLAVVYLVKSMPSIFYNVPGRLPLMVNATRLPRNTSFSPNVNRDGLD